MRLEKIGWTERRDVGDAANYDADSADTGFAGKAGSECREAHAFAPAGQDIVCAAASMLPYTAAKAPAGACGRGRRTATCLQSDGTWRPADPFCQPMPDGRVEALFDTLATGFPYLLARAVIQRMFASQKVGGQQDFPRYNGNQGWGRPIWFLA